MCGIAGLVYRDAGRPCDAATILAMRDVFAYRGPDEAGLHVDGPAGLGHRRLSIIDLGGGQQPMPNESGTLWLSYNGEIYNYREIRDDLSARGHRFRTSSDTEVILALYEAYGEDCVQAMNGMFAFAIWDSAKRSLFLARDRMGVKPLYYADTPDGFVFASEIKSIFESGLIAPEWRTEATSEYLYFRQVAGPDTLFKGVTSLPPGHTMTVRDGRIESRSYWSPLPSDPPTTLRYEDALAEFAALLDDAVRMRLVSDVPVGTFCSGGVDSSLVTAIATRFKSEPINTYSIGFDESDFDESEYARQVSDHCGTMHHQLRVGNVQYADLFPKMVWHNDEPLDFANSVHIFALSELAKQSVTVVLTGEGSDELFAGYPRYRIPGLARSYGFVPSPVRQLVTTLSGDHRLAKLDRYAAAAPADVMAYNSSYLAPEMVGQIAPGHRKAGIAFREACLERGASLGLDPVSQLSLLDQQTFLVSILHRQDKMSMAASIESRVPFMDYRLVEFANRLPSEFKIRRGSGKAIVKDRARQLLPPGIVDRRKSGFGVPLARWFRSHEGLGPLVEALPEHPKADLFDRTALRRLVAEHRAGSHDHSEVLWTVLNVCTWRESFRC